MTRSLSIAVSVLALGLLASPAAADPPAYTGEPIGGPGDIQNTIVCPPGQYLKGLRGRTGDWVDRLTIICTQLKPGGIVGGSKSTESVGGNGGSDDLPALCPASIAYSIIEYLTPDSRMVRGVRLLCGDPPTHKSTGHVTFGPGYTGQQWKSSCPQGMAAVGIAAHWGTHVNAVAIACNPLVIP